MIRASAVGAIAICAILLTTTALYAESLGEWYDTNGNGVIDKEEVLDAIADYFRDKLTREGVVNLIIDGQPDLGSSVGKPEYIIEIVSQKVKQ